MILAAHIGVGIAGVEGTAATNSADYAIGTFRMLHSLLFVHGFYSYQRMAKLTNFIFYKVSYLSSRPRSSRDIPAPLSLCALLTSISTFVALLYFSVSVCSCRRLWWP